MPRDRSRERSPRERRRDGGRDEDRDRDRDRRERPRDRDRSYRDGDRRRDREHEDRRDREYDRDAGRDRDRVRERDHKDDRAHQRRGRSADRETSKAAVAPIVPMEVEAAEPTADVPPLDLGADITPEEMQMMQAMGIPFGFDTTQGQHVDDDKANAGGVKVKQTRRARQYMNRRGGFNRALPAERSGQTALRD